MSREKEDKQTTSNDTLASATRFGVASASTEIVQRYGSAVKEHLVAYSGQDNEIGQTLTKGLKSISEERVNPNFRYQNLKQQAGFSAEVKESANKNAKRIISGEKTRKVRTDDLGRVNDPLYDHVDIDSSGNIIPDSGSQMKFVGSSPKEAYKKLTSKKFAKYIENNVNIEVPADHFFGIMIEIDDNISSLEEQISKQSQKGNFAQVEKLQKKLETAEKLKFSLRRSSVSTDDAMFARLFPALSTAKSIVELSHDAGKESAKYGAAIGGGVSLAKNIVSLAKGDENFGEAAISIAQDTVTASALSYGTGFAGSTVKGLMQNAKSKTVTALSNTNLPAMIVSASIELSHVIRSYFNGEINETQALEQLGEKGVGALTSSYCATIGSVVLPGIGTVVGSMVGYMVSSMLYNSCLQIMRDADLAREKYFETKAMCEAARELMRQQRVEFETNASQMLDHRAKIFDGALFELMDNLKTADTSAFTSALSAIAHEFGRELQFNNEEEFDNFMAHPASTFTF